MQARLQMNSLLRSSEASRLGSKGA